jgi:hypothetical protein
MINERMDIVFLFLLLIGVGLVGCKANILNTAVCPDKTSVEVGVTETDSKNDKLQEKRSITQTWKWGKKVCDDR